MFAEKSRIAAATVSRLTITALAVFLSSSMGEAASVVIDEAGINAIYSQAVFEDTPISIRFNPAKQIVAPELLIIDSAAKLQALYSLATDSAPTVVALFVDKLTFCATVEPTTNAEYGGCAQLPGRFMVEDFHFAELVPSELMAHELGHNLNLQHNFDFTSLMNVLFPPGTTVYEDEVATMLQSPLVQTDSKGQRFIQITPIAIVDAPEPSTLLLLSATLGALLIIKTKKSRTMRPQL